MKKSIEEWRTENALSGTHKISQQYNEVVELFKWELKMWFSGRVQQAWDAGVNYRKVETDRELELTG